MSELLDRVRKYTRNSVRYWISLKHPESRWTDHEIEIIWNKIKKMGDFGVVTKESKLEILFRKEVEAKKDNKGVTWKEREEELK